MSASVQTIIRNTTVVNEGQQWVTDVYLKNGLIEQIDPVISVKHKVTELNAEGMVLIPGAIDDQVHFREPGLTHKGTIFSESKAAIAGGITSYMEMPNTIPNTLTQKLLQEKYDLAAKDSWANYSFFMGVSNDNLDEVLRTDIRNVCGIKVFLGSSTGSMLVDNPGTLEQLFKQSPMLIAAHCEDEPTIKRNLTQFLQQYGDTLNVQQHPLIRSEEACYLSSSFAVELAQKNKTRLHVLHISTARELELFTTEIPLKEKRITSEACIHHLWFDDRSYPEKGNLIKWNPSIKTPNDRTSILEAVIAGKIDVIATDHAPHTWEEKQAPYLNAPSGGPLVQHALVAMLELVDRKKITLEKVVEKMCHAPADCFQIKSRGYVREGYFADLVLVNRNEPWQVKKNNLLYKCEWSPFEEQWFTSKVKHTFVNGNHIYNNGEFNFIRNSMRLLFERN